MITKITVGQPEQWPLPVTEMVDLDGRARLRNTGTGARAQSPRMELNGATGMVLANVKVEFAGTAKSAWNLVEIQRIRRRAIGSIVILRPNERVGAAGGRKRPAIQIAREQPVANLGTSGAGGVRNEITCALGLPASPGRDLAHTLPRPRTSTP